MVTKRSAVAVGFAVSVVPALVGLATSCALLVDMWRPRPVFCSAGGGCDAVKQTAFASPLGIPLPVIGVAGFMAIAVTAWLAGPRARLAHLALSAVAGLAGLFLLAVQARLGEVCPYCCVVDGSGIAAALGAVARMVAAPDDGASRPLAYAYAGAGGVLIALGAPLLAGFHMSPVPRAIRDQIARTPKGEVTVVDFVDFECPFCRMTQTELAPVLASHKNHIRLVRLQVPLRSHPHALDAARAACCGERLGRGDEMASALFSAPVAELTPAGCEAIAQRIGVPLDDYRACVADPSTQARIDDEHAIFKAAGGYALPTLWIGEQELIGAQKRPALAKVLEEALERAGS